MIKYYNNDIKQPTAEWIDYHFYESVDEYNRFIFKNRFDRKGGNSFKDCIAGGYNIHKDIMRYSMKFDNIGYNNASKLLWILKNDRAWPTYANGKHLLVDHIDGNSENNFIWNIRPATENQNQYNCKNRSNNTSGYKGVSWNKDRNKWLARCVFNKKAINIGLYDNKEDAAIAYNKKMFELCGDYFKPNIIKGA